MGSDQNTSSRDGLRTSNPPGFLSKIAGDLSASQAVVVPPNVSLVVTSGQCGFREDGSIPEDIQEQVDQAFQNAERVLKAAGVAQGWQNVYEMTLYYTSLDEPFVSALQSTKRRYLGDNRPVLTGLMVPEGYQGSVFEMTLHAYISN
ncbi:uncharacterized protein PV06_10656 [Exophiala oligosperma]|uniref:Uncharacterized protein n=2 Tax=Chaetothyriales TaxID=34395 RepID=A0A0D2D173_9EURO|nr:uncharacterized protein PV06_10656 [Exophiala oligosperma]KAJ9640125.1 hypothetical protein H2204_003350 [Knufia peltigerae]KIW37023.1 hypothetical protein PV06_10656 [Exophiala oligosperma]